MPEDELEPDEDPPLEDDVVPDEPLEPLEPPPRGAADPVVDPVFGRDPACPPPRVSCAASTGVSENANAAATRLMVSF